MLYPSLCRFPMIMLSCQSLHPDAISAARVEGKDPAAWATETYLRWDMEERCYGEQHLANVLLIALPSILVYALGLPLSAGLILWRNREFHESKKFRFRLGLIYSGFRRDRWWWESIVVMRKLFIIFFASFMYTDALQVQFALGMMVTAFALHHMYLPFDVDPTGKKLHILERNSILVSTLLLWSATVFIEAKTCEQGLCYILLIVVMVTNIAFLVTSLALFLRFFLEKHHRVVENLLRYIPKRISRGLSVGHRASSGADSGGDVEGETGGVADGVTDNAPHNLAIHAIELTSTTPGFKTKHGEGKDETAAGAPSKLPEGWNKYEDHAGQTYYYNSDTNESQWDAPLATATLDWASNPIMLANIAANNA